MATPSSSVLLIDSITKFILNHFKKLGKITKYSSKPLIVAINGPQGSGKTTLVNQLKYQLKNHSDQLKLSSKYPDNKLLKYRGQPGTHDILLGVNFFKKLCDNQFKYSTSSSSHNRSSREKEEGEKEVLLVPSYDKSLNNGQGNRLSIDKWTKSYPPFDIMLFEGWCVGFKSLKKEDLKNIYYDSNINNDCYSLENILLINENLKNYEKHWYKYFDIFIHLDVENIIENKKEEEEEIKSCTNLNEHYGKHLRIILDKNRQLISETVM
nr:4688_t:CDS:2 [Entrophospora candida]CAG8488220.1 5696_t:CDS:2 [Entrophospora candida]